jgi:hypothetical protein
MAAWLDHNKREVQFLLAVSGRDNIMAQSAQKANGRGVNIFVGEEVHGVVARWTCSTTTTSMAY